MGWDGAPAPNMLFLQKGVQNSNLQQVNVFGIPLEEHAEILKQLSQLPETNGKLCQGVFPAVVATAMAEATDELEQ